MNDFSFDSLIDLQAVADNYQHCPKGSRLLVAKRLMNRLNELKGTVTISEDNPLNIYKCDRFVVKKQFSENPFDKYYDYLLDSQSIDFNQHVFKDMYDKVSKYNKNVDIINTCKELNTYANMLNIKGSGIGDYINILVKDVDLILNFYTNGSDTGVVERALDEIEYMLNTSTLNYYIIKRHLIPVILIKNHSLYSRQDNKGISERIDKIYGTVIEPIDDPFEFFRRGNRGNIIEQYMRMQKMDYEQTFVDSELYDNTYEKKSSLIKVESLIPIYESIKNSNKYLELKTSDIFRLNKNGFNDIEDFRPETYNYKARLTAYRKNGINYLIRKSADDDNVYYFISKNKKGELKCRTITFKPNNNFKSIDDMSYLLESTLSNINKMNRR